MQREVQPLKPTHEEIARLAYLIWDKEGRPQDRDVKHWCEAESLLLAATRRELRSLHATMSCEHPPKQGMIRKEYGRYFRHDANRMAA